MHCDAKQIFLWLTDSRICVSCWLCDEQCRCSHSAEKIWLFLWPFQRDSGQCPCVGCCSRKVDSARCVCVCRYWCPAVYLSVSVSADRSCCCRIWCGVKWNVCWKALMISSRCSSSLTRRWLLQTENEFWRYSACCVHCTLCTLYVVLLKVLLLSNFILKNS